MGRSCETKDAYRSGRFAREPIETADLISLAVEQLPHPAKIPLTRISATSVGRLFEALSTPLLLIDRSLRIAFANSACRKIGFDYEKTLGCSVNCFFSHEGTAKGFRLLMEKVFVNRVPLIVEVPVRVGRAKVAARLHLRALRFGKKQSVLLIIEDLTDEKGPSTGGSECAELALEELASSERLKELLGLKVGGRENGEYALQKKDRILGPLPEIALQIARAQDTSRNPACDVIVICDMSGRAWYVNSSFTRVLGWAVPELRGKEMGYTPESPHEITVSHMLDWIVSCQTCEQLPAVPYAQKGGPVSFELSASGSAEPARRPDGLPLIFKDLMRHQTAEETVRRSEETARALLNASGDAVGLLDIEGLVLASNPIFADRLGLTVEQFVGRNLLEFFPERLAQARMERGKQAIETGRPVRFSDERAGRYLDNTVCPLFDHYGRVELLAVVSRDITNHVRTLAELQRAREATEVAKRAKSEFLANVSHELRTPLNSIIGFSEILEDQLFGQLNAKQLAHVGQVLSSGRQLLQLIDNILDLANVESGEMELRIAGVNIGQLLESSMVMIGERASKQGLTTRLRVTDELADVLIEADQAKLRQIVFTLLSNALKFTPAGGEIVVEADKRMDDVVISVTDTGIGLKPEDQDRVFQVFEQVDSSHTRKHPGTGLGLALTKKMVELHGGKIWVHSPGEGRGGPFAFTIPVCSLFPTVSAAK